MAVHHMVGHMKWAVHIRLPITSSVVGGKEYLTIAPCMLQPELQELLDADGALVGVDIHEDLRDFNFQIDLVTGSRLQFFDPIDITVVACLAGFNLPCDGVASLVWTVLGGFLPKGVASIGDGSWFLPLDKMCVEHKLYLRGDTAQLSITFWTIIAAWVMNIFPDIHCVIESSVSALIGDLLAHSVECILDDRVALIERASSWTLATSRLEAVRAATAGSDHQSLLLRLTPDWPTVAAGGCRYMHTARAWQVDRPPDLVKMDPKFWLPDYRERVFFLRLCHTVPPELSPCDPVRRLSLSLNPGISDILPTPASTVDQHALKDLVGPSRPKRAILYEYALFHPMDAADLLLHNEGNTTFTHELFVAKLKVRIFVGALRGILQSLGAMPPRPEGWIDPYPGFDDLLIGLEELTLYH
jgi:hypothetical protein